MKGKKTKVDMINSCSGTVSGRFSFSAGLTCIPIAFAAAVKIEFYWIQSES